jgi:hypothetical protein
MVKTDIYKKAMYLYQSGLIVNRNALNKHVEVTELLVDLNQTEVVEISELKKYFEVLFNYPNDNVHCAGCKWNMLNVLIQCKEEVLDKVNYCCKNYNYSIIEGKITNE